MNQALVFADERYLPEPGNTRGWPLNRKQLDWALAVVRDGLSALAAAKLVYGDRVSKRTPETLRIKLAPFLAHLQERKNALAEREFDASVERVLRESAAIALSDKLGYLRRVTINKLPRFIGKPPDQLTPMQRIAVHSHTEIEITTDEGPDIDYRYRLYGKQAAIEFLGKHLGMTSEKLLIEMTNRRMAAQIPDYTNVSTQDLKDAIATMLAIQEKMRDSQAIPGEVAKPN